MKKYYKLLLTSIVVLTTACNQAETATVTELPNAEPQSEIRRVEFSQQMLEFSSQEEFSTTLMDLITMTQDDRRKWFADKKDFTSQLKAAMIVSEQLGKCSTLEEAIKLRDSYAEFVFNENPTELDFTPYAKADQLGHSFIVNVNGDVKIAGKVVNFNNVKSYQDTWASEINYIKTKGIASDVNTLHIWTDERKMWVEAFYVFGYNMQGALQRKSLILRANAQQKVCFIFCAWHTYINEFIFNIRFPRSYSGFDPYTGGFSSLYRSGTEVVVRAGDSHALSMGDLTGAVINAELLVHTQGVGANNQGVLKISNPRRVNFYAATGRYDW